MSVSLQDQQDLVTVTMHRLKSDLHKKIDLKTKEIAELPQTYSGHKWWQETVVKAIGRAKEEWTDLLKKMMNMIPAVPGVKKIKYSVRMTITPGGVENFGFKYLSEHKEIPAEIIAEVCCRNNPHKNLMGVSRNIVIPLTPSEIKVLEIHRKEEDQYEALCAERNELERELENADNAKEHITAFLASERLLSTSNGSILLEKLSGITSLADTSRLLSPTASEAE